MTAHSREERIIRAFIEAVVAPEGHLPAVEDTDATGFLVNYLRDSPWLNGTGLRAVLQLLELGSLPRYRHAMHALSPKLRTEYLLRASRGPLGPLVKALASVAKLSYYGDTQLLARFGYDSDANLRRARELRAAEGRW
jgi:hypothetical protein